MEKAKRAAPVFTTYEKWMQGEGVPIAEAIGGIEDVRELERKPWARMEGKGAFVYLQGMKEGGVNGMYVAEIPPGKSLSPEKHLYEEIVYVLKGQGATEIWQKDQPKRSFEWGEGTLFSPPLNTWHRLHNVGREPVLFIAVTTAPIVMDLFHNADFAFEADYLFRDRYNGQEDYFRVGDKLDAGPRESVIWETNFIPDVRAALVDPKDLGKGEGVGIMGFDMSDNILCGHISEWPAGAYHKAHYHGPGAILLGLKSEGYVLLWPKRVGTTPFKDGCSDEVIKINWKEGSVYSPGDGWFHQHFNTGSDPARHLAFHRGYAKHKVGFSGRGEKGYYVSVKQGGFLIEYEDEDPEIRKQFETALKKSGIALGMPARRG